MFSRNLSHCITFFLITALAALAEYYYLSDEYSEALHRESERISSLEHSIQLELKQIHEAVGEQLTHTAAQIAANPDPSFIQKTLLLLGYNQPKYTRTNWANHEHKIIYSSHSQHMAYLLDISSREYIQQSVSSPKQTHISPILQHLDPQVKQRIIVYAIGIKHKDIYKGTVFTIIDVNALIDQLGRRFETCQCLFWIENHYGETLLASANIEKPLSSHINQRDGFRAIIQADPEQIKSLKSQFHKKLSITLSATILFCMAIYLIIRQRVIKPVSKALALMMPPAAAIAAPAASADQDTISRLMQLADHYRDMQARLEQQEQLIEDFTASLRHLRAQHQRFMLASGGEMQAVYAAINGYAEHLEERIFSQQLDPDAIYDYDEVREMGANLKHLADIYSRFSAPCAANEPIELADPQRIIRKNLLTLEPMIERRNLCFDLTSMRDVWIAQPAAVQRLSALSHSLLYAAIRHAEDEANLTITIVPSGEQIHLLLSVSRFAQRYLPPAQQDFGMFAPAMRHDMRPAMVQHLWQHANVMVAQALAMQMGGQLDIGYDEQAHTGFHLKAALAAKKQTS